MVARCGRLCKLLPWFIDPVVFQEVKTHPHLFIGLVNLFQELYSYEVRSYRVDQIAGLLSGAFIFKGGLWASMPRIISALSNDDSDKRRDIALQELKKLLLNNKCSLSVVNWLCDNIDGVDDSALVLLDYLSDTRPDICSDERLVTDILKFSQGVSINNNADDFIDVFTLFSTFKLSFSLVLTKIMQQERDQKLEKLAWESFLELVHLM